jgi:acyl-CoA thioesterase FadM
MDKLDFRTNLLKLKKISNYYEYHTSVTDMKKKYYRSSLKYGDVIFISIVMLAIQHSSCHLHVSAYKWINYCESGSGSQDSDKRNAL